MDRQQPCDPGRGKPRRPGELQAASVCEMPWAQLGWHSISLPPPPAGSARQLKLLSPCSAAVSDLRTQSLRGLAGTVSSLTAAAAFALPLNNLGLLCKPVGRQQFQPLLVGVVKRALLFQS